MSSPGKSHQNDDCGRTKSDRRSSPNHYYRSKSRDKDQSSDNRNYRHWFPSRREKEGSRWDSDRHYKITYHERFRHSTASTYIPYLNPHKLDRRNAPGREQNYAKDDNYENSESFTLFGESNRPKNALPEDHWNGQPRQKSAENSANATSGKQRSMKRAQNRQRNVSTNDRRISGRSEMHKKAITEHLKNTFLRNNSPLTQVPPMFSHNQLLIDKLIAEEAIKMLSSGKAASEEASFNDTTDAAEVSPSPTPTATVAETAKPSTPIGIKLPVRTISKATVAADSALLQKSAEQVTRKLINQLTTMNKYNLKQMIDNPAGKYETALNRHAQSKVRAEMRKQLKNFHPVEAIKEKDSQHESYVLAPDEVIDLERLPDALLDQLQNALDLDMFSVPCPETTERTSKDVSISDDESAHLDTENESSTEKRVHTTNAQNEPEPEKASEGASTSASVAVANEEPLVPTGQRATRDTSSLMSNIKKRWSYSGAETSVPSKDVAKATAAAEERGVKSPQMEAPTSNDEQQRPVVVRTYGRRVLPKAYHRVSSNETLLVGAPEPSDNLDEKNGSIENQKNVVLASNPEQPTAGCSGNGSQRTPVSQAVSATRSAVKNIPPAANHQKLAVKKASFLRVSTVDELNKRIDTKAEEATEFNSLIPPPATEAMSSVTNGLEIQQTIPMLNEPSSVNQTIENESFTAPGDPTPAGVVTQVKTLVDRSKPPVNSSAIKQFMAVHKTPPTKATGPTTPNRKTKQFVKGKNKSATQQLLKKQISPARGNIQTSAKTLERTKGIICLVPVTDEESPLPSEQMAFTYNQKKKTLKNNKAQTVCSSSTPNVPSNERQVNHKTASMIDNAKSKTTHIAKKRCIESLQREASTSYEGASSPEHNVTPPTEAPQHTPFMRIANIRSLTEPSHHVSSDGTSLVGAIEPSSEHRTPSPVALTSLNAEPITAAADSKLRAKQLEDTPAMILPDRLPSSHEACAVILNQMHAIDSRTFELFKRKMEIDAIIMRLNIERIEIDQEIVKLQNKRDEQMDSLRANLFVPRVYQHQPEHYSSGTMNGDAMQTNDPSYVQREQQADFLPEDQDENNSSTLSANTWSNTESSSELAPNTQPSQTSSSQERTIRRITMISGNSDLMRIFQRKRVISEPSSDDNAAPEDSIMLSDVTAT